MFHVYILASERNGTLYVGSSSTLIQRIWQHKQDLADGFTKKYQIHLLVYFEEALSAETMVARERQVKKWKREWKIKLIEEKNPQWEDLYATLL